MTKNGITFSGTPAEILAILAATEDPATEEVTEDPATAGPVTEEDTEEGWITDLLDALTPAQRETYRALGVREVNINVLAERLGVSTAAASQRVRTLERLGLSRRGKRWGGWISVRS